MLRCAGALPCHMWYVPGEDSQCQGSGHAAFISGKHLVLRVLLFSKGGDFIDNNGQREAAPWTLEPRATRAERMFGLLHIRDGAENKVFMYETYGMDFYGDLVDADQEDAPYGYSHMLTTNADSKDGGSSFHNSLATDTHMPLGLDGLPLMKDAHFYMMTGPIPSINEAQ